MPESHNSLPESVRAKARQAAKPMQSASGLNQGITPYTPTVPPAHEEHAKQFLQDARNNSGQALIDAVGRYNIAAVIGHFADKGRLFGTDETSRDLINVMAVLQKTGSSTEGKKVVDLLVTTFEAEALQRTAGKTVTGTIDKGSVIQAHYHNPFDYAMKMPVEFRTEITTPATPDHSVNVVIPANSTWDVSISEPGRALQPEYFVVPTAQAESVRPDAYAELKKTMDAWQQDGTVAPGTVYMHVPENTYTPPGNFKMKDVASFGLVTPGRDEVRVTVSMEGEGNLHFDAQPNALEPVVRGFNTMTFAGRPEQVRDTIISSIGVRRTDTQNTPVSLKFEAKDESDGILSRKETLVVDGAEERKRTVQALPNLRQKTAELSR